MKKSSYPRQGFVTPGLAIQNNEAYEKEKKKKDVSYDTKVRTYVRESIEKMVKEGMELEQAAKVIAQKEEIKQHFKYLTNAKITLSLEEIFANWYIQFERNKNRSSNIWR